MIKCTVVYWENVNLFANNLMDEMTCDKSNIAQQEVLTIIFGNVFIDKLLLGLRNHPTKKIEK